MDFFYKHWATFIIYIPFGVLILFTLFKSKGSMKTLDFKLIINSLSIFYSIVLIPIVVYILIDYNFEKKFIQIIIDVLLILILIFSVINVLKKFFSTKNK